MINVDKLTYDYPRHRALDEVSVVIPEGTITAIVGPTGAGKTTFLRLLSGVMAPLSGRININGNLMWHDEFSFNNIGFVADHLGLYENLNVFQSLWYFSTLRKVYTKDRSSNIMSLIRFLDLQDVATSEVKSLNRSQRLKLAIGQGIIHKPKILLLDEPSSHIDVIARRELYTLLHQLNKEQDVTVIVSSHILSEIKDFASNLLVLKNGKLLAHKVLNTNEVSSTRILKLLLATEFHDTYDILTNMSTVSNIKKINDTTYTFSFNGKGEEQSRIVSKLIEKGVPLFSFESDICELSQFYIDMIGDEK